RRHAEGAALLRRAPGEDALRGPHGAARVAWRAEAVRAEVRDHALAGPRLAALRRARAGARALFRRAVAHLARRRAAAADDAAGSLAAPADRGRRRTGMAGVGREVAAGGTGA